MLEITAEDPLSPDAVVDGAIRLADIGASDRVTIVGHGHLELLLGLNRRGVLSASYAKPDCGLQPACGYADVVWLSDVRTPATLVGALARLDRHLKPGGAVVIGPELPMHGADGSWLRRVLFECGFTSIAQVQLGDVHAGALICARKRLPALRKAA